MTEEEIAVDYWLHYLSDRLAAAAREKVEVQTLDDLLYAATVDEKMEQIAKEAEEREQREGASQAGAPSAEAPATVDDAEYDEPVISFNAEKFRG